jgi:hypothetical protein
MHVRIHLYAPVALPREGGLGTHSALVFKSHAPQITTDSTAGPDLEPPGFTWYSSLVPEKCPNGTLTEVLTATSLIVFNSHYDLCSLESCVK